MLDISVIILAAGEGTRMKSSLPKVIHKVNGIPMLSFLLMKLDKLSVKQKIVVLGYKKERIVEILPPGVEWVEQKEQLGTGHAVKVVLEEGVELEETALVLCGDIPLLTTETLERLISSHEKNGCGITILSAIKESPFAYGRIVRNDNGEVLSIVEEKDATDDERKIKEINSGIYCFNSDVLKNCLNQVTANNQQGEYYLTDVIEIYRNQGGKVDAVVAPDDLEITGINSLVDLSWATKHINRQTIKKWQESGVTVIDPENTFIDTRVQIGKDTIIQPMTFLEGDTRIGNNCQIGPVTQVINSQLHDNTSAKFSVLEDVDVASGSFIAPFSHIRCVAEVADNEDSEYHKTLENAKISPRNPGSKVLVACGGFNGKMI